MIAISAMAALTPSIAIASTPRELLTTAAFEAPNKPRALALVGQAIAASDRILAVRPADTEALLQRGVAIGYRGKLTRSRSDVRTSIGIFERLAAANPRNPEAHLVIAGWHLGAVDQLGSFMARTALGAKSKSGETALARAVALGGDRSFYTGMAAMLHIRNDHSGVAQARRWAEAAASGSTPTELDVLMKKAAIALLPSLRANDGKAAAALASKLMPFGKLSD